MNKIGFTLDERVREITSSSSQLSEKQKEKKDKLQQNIDQIFARFKELETYSENDPKNRVSQRIKILIKNLFSDKQSNWAKSREVKKI